MNISILSFFAVALLLACGSEEENQSNTKTETAPTSTACEAAGTKICERACACATDGQCRVGTPTPSGNASINFVDEKACRDVYVVLGCWGGGEPGFDYARCDTAMEASSCVDTAGGRGALMPAECNVSRK